MGIKKLYIFFEQNADITIFDTKFRVNIENMTNWHPEFMYNPTLVG